MSWKALSTLIRDLADVSMNAQPNWRARSSPSVWGRLVCSRQFMWRYISKVLGEVRVGKRRTLSGNLSVVVKIAFVADDDDGKVVPILNAKYLLLKRQYLLKALP